MDNSNKKNKIILIVSIIFLVVGYVSLIYMFNRYDRIRLENDNIRKEIDKVRNDILTIDIEYENGTKKLDDKKIELKDKIREYNIWQEMKEKVK